MVEKVSLEAATGSLDLGDSQNGDKNLWDNMIWCSAHGLIRSHCCPKAGTRGFGPGFDGCE